MLEHAPHWLGRALRGVRPGPDKALHALVVPKVPADIALISPSFIDGGSLPVRYTADGVGLSPAIEWTGVPGAAGGLLLVIEDVDSPTPRPLVHAIVAPASSSIADGFLPSATTRGGGANMGRNSFFRRQYSSPDPPPGHGPHRYVFQLFALRRPLPGRRLAGRREIAESLRDNVLAKGVLTAHYERR